MQNKKIRLSVDILCGIVFGALLIWGVLICVNIVDNELSKAEMDEVKALKSIEPEASENILSVVSEDAGEIIRFETNGDIFWRRRLVVNDHELIAAARDWLSLASYGCEKAYQNQNSEPKGESK